MDGSIGKDLLGQIAGQMGGLSGDQMKQAENIWKMLDNLSESNPDQYKDFVKNNLQNGFQEIKKEKDEKIKELKVQAEPILLLKMQAKLQQFKLQKEEHPLYQVQYKMYIEQLMLINEIFEQKQLRVIDQDTKKKLEDVKKSVDKEVKIYVNVLTSNRVRGPLNDQGKEVSNLKDMEQWKVIPYSLQDPQQRKSTSLGNMVYFYEFAMNDEVCKMMSGSPPLTEQLVTFIIEKMNSCLKEHRNPLLKLYDYMQENEIIHYQISKLSIVRHKSKKFKLPDSKIRTFPPILIEPEADRQFDLQKVRDEMQKKKNSMMNQMPFDITQQQQQQQQSQVNPIKDVSDIKSRQQEEEKVKEVVKEQVLDGLRIVSKEEKEKNQQQKPKKVMIQEMDVVEAPQQTKATQQKPTKTAQQIIEESIEKPSYNLKEQSETVYIEILLFKVNSIDEMILDVSERKLKLEVPLVYKLEIPLPSKINTEQVAPKWNKKTKVLKLTLIKSTH